MAREWKLREIRKQMCDEIWPLYWGKVDVRHVDGRFIKLSGL